MPIFQYQVRPSVPLANVGTPVNSGMPWFKPWEPPRFKVTETPSYQQQTEFRRIDPAQPVAAVSGVAWLRDWESPRFRTDFPSHQQQINFTRIDPNIPIAAVSGIAWLRDWEPPRFKGVPSNLQQSELAVFTLSILPPITSAMWHKDWVPPSFRSMPPELVQSELATITGTNVPSVSGIPWMKVWEPPFFPTSTKVQLQQTLMWSPTPDTLPIGISGIAWYRDWVQPRFKDVPTWFPNIFGLQIPIFVPTPVSGISWMKPWEPPRFVVPIIHPIEMKGVLLSSTLPPRPILVGRRKPLYTPPTPVTTEPAAIYPANFWKGQTD